jgi:uncharacterized integral membrane protein
MRFITAILAALLAIFAVAFAVDNRETVGVGFWPLPLQVVMPLFLIVLGAAFIGFLLGCLVAWWSGRHARSEARRRARDVSRLEARIAVLESEARQVPVTASLPPA